MLYDDTKFPVSACSKLHARKLWDERRFPTGKICEDAFITCELIHDADKLVYLPESLYHYRIRPRSIMSSGFTRKRMDEEEAWRHNCRFIKDNYPHLYKTAFTFYLQKVVSLTQAIKNDDIYEFSDEYEYLRKTAKNNVGFMMFGSTANLKYKVRFFIDMIKMQSVV